MDKPKNGIDGEAGRIVGNFYGKTAVSPAVPTNYGRLGKRCKVLAGSGAEFRLLRGFLAFCGRLIISSARLAHYGCLT